MAQSATVVRPRLLNRELVLLYLATLGAMTSFYLLLSVVPLYAKSAGAGDVGAGLTTAALMLTTVGGDLVTPTLAARFGYRAVYVIGLLLLGLPALVLIGSASLVSIVVVCLTRGLGFAIAVVLGSALAGTLAAPERRNEAVGMYGVMSGVPSIVALPLGLWLVDQVGYPPLFIGAAVTASLALIAVLGLPGRSVDPIADHEHVGVLTGLRTAALIRPAAAFGVVAMVAGILVTFLPLVLLDIGWPLAAVALFVQAVAATTTRWWAGRHSDRHGPGRLMVPAVLAAGAGVLLLLLVPSPIAVLVGLLLYGIGFGLAQNASIAIMFNRVPRTAYGTVSALWNMAYDSGWVIGAAGFGLLAARTGYRVAFAVTGALVLATIGLRWRDRDQPAVRSTL